MVFLLHAPASAPIKIGCGLVWCGLVGCVGEAYTPTLRDLETTRQRENETFPEFLVRWRAKALKMMNRPNEKDQVNMVMKGLLLVYYNWMFASPIIEFEQLCNSGMRIEDAIDNGQLDKIEGRISVAPKKVFESSSKMPNIQANINVVQQN